MATYKTPGVFVEEIPALAASVAGVETAITGFVGYTEKAVFADGTSATMKPVRITSLLEYQTIFGGPKEETFTVTLTTGPSGNNVIATGPTTDSGALSKYILYYQLQMFFANGGGTCYIVSVDNYSVAINQTTLLNNIIKFEQIDEITLLCVPESVWGNDTERLNINTEMLKQANRLQDRFAVMDVLHTTGKSIFQDAQNFRNLNTGADNLKYGAAYYPALKTGLSYFYQDTGVTIVDSRSPVPLPSYPSPYNKLNFIANGSTVPAVAAGGSIQVTTAAGLTNNSITVNNIVVASPANFTVVTGNNNATALNLFNAIIAMVPSVTATLSTDTITLTATIPGAAGNITITTTGTGVALAGMTGGVNAIVNVLPDKILYNAITTEIQKYILELYPSASMAGVYARVDGERGVWKAPANVGLFLTSAPTIQITNGDQENLNVDSTSGKSINAIRTFTGRGTLVWGARTLAGNDNEWRYVNVRRLFLYAEESIKKATEFVVFEANDKPTWERLKGMIGAFLTNLWRDGGIVGSKPEDAFFVNVGLGTTMTPQDILEGKLIVEIGLAASRPAEFIILRFMHKLQE